MKLSKNLTFLKHKAQIEQVLVTVSESARSSGEMLFKDMLVSAEQLDTVLAPLDGSRPNPAAVSVSRDDFHKKCRDLGEWLSVNAPELQLKWD